MACRSVSFTALLMVMLVGCSALGPDGSGPASSSAEPPDVRVTPSVAVSAAPTAVVSPTPSASTQPGSSASPTVVADPDQAQLIVGEMVEPGVDGLRARQRPGTSGAVLDTLPRDALGLVELGPLPADGYSWYRVQYSYLNAFGVTDGGTGWIASGSRDAPWLVPTERQWDHGPITGVAGSGSALIDPVEMNDPWQEIRWAASGADCQFELAFEAESKQAVAVTDVVRGYAEGVVEDLFPDSPDFVGLVSVRITTGCDWTYAIVTYIG